MNSTIPRACKAKSLLVTHGGGFPLDLQNKQRNCLFLGRSHKRSDMACVKPPLLPSVLGTNTDKDVIKKKKMLSK